jgi:hypothetical protein
MSDIIDNLLKQESVNEKLKDYIYISINNFDQVPLGSHIKFIDRDENIKTGGFLIKFVKNKDRTKCYYILKSNIIYKLYIYYFWVFYKDITHESNISKAIKSLKNNIDTNEFLKESTNKQLKVPDSDSQKNSSATMNIIIKNNKKDNKDKKNKILSKSVEKDVKEEVVKEEVVKEEVKEEVVKEDKKRNNSKREAFLSLLNSLNKNN